MQGHGQEEEVEGDPAQEVADEPEDAGAAVCQVGGVVAEELLLGSAPLERLARRHDPVVEIETVDPRRLDRGRIDVWTLGQHRVGACDIGTAGDGGEVVDRLRAAQHPVVGKCLEGPETERRGADPTPGKTDPRLPRRRRRPLPRRAGAHNGRT